MPKKKSPPQIDPATVAFELARSALLQQPIFAPLLHHARLVRRNDDKNNGVPREGWAVVQSDGIIRVHPTRRAEAGEWIYVLAHCLLHLAWNHIRENPSPAWNAACDCVVARFLSDISLGDCPLLPPHAPLPAFPGRDEAALERAFEEAVPDWARALGTAAGAPDTGWVAPDPHPWAAPPDWNQLFSSGLSQALMRAVRVASGDQNPDRPRTQGQQARSWFIASFPLLGALAAGFELLEDGKLCSEIGIPIAAISIERREIYFNPNAGLSEGAFRFVMAHELLHAGLRHDARQGARDAYYWNVSCDFVINDWLLEMGIGEPPTLGMLHDPSLRGLSAEAIYDLITHNLRRFRRLGKATMRGNEQSDILSSDEDFSARMGATSLDAWLRGALVQGLQLHDAQGRGFLPLGLVEEIRALQMPVVPWDVELAQWFDSHFAPLEKRRSFARMSRRQSASPDIVRPALVVPEEARQSRTFGALIDTSGSMDRSLLAKALGTIASYAIAHEVPAVRVVFCDASAYDAGFLRPEEIAGRVQVRGRGGTVLQPGVHLLQSASDFPDDAPILILTDGACEPDLSVSREHAFVVPLGAKLAFRARGPVFSVR